MATPVTALLNRLILSASDCVVSIRGIIFFSILFSFGDTVIPFSALPAALTTLFLLFGIVISLDEG